MQVAISGCNHPHIRADGLSSTDTFELRDDVMYWTGSASVIERQTETRSN